VFVDETAAAAAAAAAAATATATAAAAAAASSVSPYHLPHLHLCGSELLSPGERI
jgi:hypothetical protein